MLRKALEGIEMAPPLEQVAQRSGAPDVRQAVTLHQSGRLREAEWAYTVVLAADPQQFDALHLLGVLRQQQGRSVEALQLIAAALRTNPQSADALANYGLALDALKRQEEALASFDRALALDRDHVNALNNRGLTLKALGRTAEAMASWDRALAVDPDHFDSLHNRGNALHDAKRHVEALVDYDKALAVRPDHADILNNRGGSLEELGRFEEAIECYDRAIKAGLGVTEVHVNKGNALVALHRFEEALASYAAARAIEPDRPEVRWSEGLVRLRMGDFAEGWRGYQWRWLKADWADRRRRFSQPLWLGEEPLARRTILLHAEQGLGDTLQFVRYAPLVACRGAKVILEVQPALKTLLSAVEGVAAVAGQGEALPAFDLHCPLMSLPLAFGTELGTVPADIPYLRAPPDRLANWRNRLARGPANASAPAMRLAPGAGGAPRVGIAWAGNPAHRTDRYRSIALDRFAALFDLPGVTFVGLQKDSTAAQKAVLRNRANVIDLGDAFDDFADTAALIATLDLVVAVDTAVAHLAGAMGKPVWILLPFSADFRWLIERDDSPWYPSARLFRQRRIGDWDDVIERVREALNSMTA
jgi:tetratricopeptide (TPR) repeat protein